MSVWPRRSTTAPASSTDGTTTCRSTSSTSAAACASSGRAEHRPETRRHLAREALQARIGVVGLEARWHRPGDDVGEPVLADEGRELLHAVLDIAHHPGL